MKKIILLLVVGILVINFFGLVSAEGTFTPIFCNDYEFTCCGGKVDSTYSYFVTDEIPWTCPSYAYKCIILNSEDKEYWVGQVGCGLYQGIYDRWECNPEQKLKSVMSPSDQVYLRNGILNVEGNLQIKIIRPQLGFCGKSGAVGEEVTCGVAVDGADGCKFNPTNGIIYTSTSSLSGKQQTSSYTVPIGNCILAFQSGDRHICGYKEESCSSNADCSGHTYGNQECNGRTLQTYGCNSYGNSISEKDRAPSDTGWGENKIQPSQSGTADFGKRCEIINAQQVQCCGDTDCGTNFFCDNNPSSPTVWTCQEKVQCHQNSDCGISIQCDWTTNNLKTPLCESGQCKFKEQKVDCCLNKNCDEGSFCNINHECEVGSGHNLDVTNSNASNLNGGLSSSKSSSSSTGTIILIILLTIIGGSIGFFVYVKNKKKKIKSVVKKDTKGNAKHCRKCGGVLRPNSKFCSKCGKMT